MDLSTRYLGLLLAHPFMPGASPLTEDLDMVLRLEDAGAPALVMHSLFEEDMTAYGETADRHLEQLLRIKRRVRIPVIASLNGTTAAGWLRYAQLMERAGADAIELNVYHVACDFDESGASVERRAIDIVAVLKESVRIPIAVKLSPYYSSVAHLVVQLDRIGADGVVLFNRFYEPDIDADRRTVAPQLQLSDPSELGLRLRWTAILSGRIRASLAVTGGVHDAAGATKAIMAGADCVQIVSALLAHGPKRLADIRAGFEHWADEHEYDSVADVRGRAAMTPANADVFQRGNYVRLLRTWRDAAPPGSGH